MANIRRLNNLFRDAGYARVRRTLEGVISRTGNAAQWTVDFTVDFNVHRSVCSFQEFLLIRKWICNEFRWR